MFGIDAGASQYYVVTLLKAVGVGEFKYSSLRTLNRGESTFQRHGMTPLADEFVCLRWPSTAT